MEVISHRGYWKSAKEKNTKAAFVRSFEAGFGTETDVRDFGGALVVSHDPPTEDDALMNFDEFLCIYKDYSCSGFLAINVKSDGLQNLIARSLDKFGITSYALFDMAVPDMVQTYHTGLNFLSRVSDVEPAAVMMDVANGIWLDEFFEEWIDAEVVESYLLYGKKVCVVSSELHGRTNTDQWAKLNTPAIVDAPNFILCTDYPDQAARHFKVQK